MKNKISKLIAILAIAVVAVYNLGLVSRNSDMSDVSLANVEALASENSTIPTIPCTSQKYSTCSYLCYDGNGTLRTCTTSNHKKV
jgi:hypothetical protein